MRKSATAGRRLRRRFLAFAAFAIVSAAPPGAPPAADAETLYRDGVAARHAGDPARAVALLRQAVAAEPDNADARLQLGLALTALGRLDEAEAELRRTLEIAPGYEDARIALARIAQRRGDREAALAALEPVGAENREAIDLRAQLARRDPEEARWQLDIDGSYSALDGGRADWTEGAVQLRHRASERTAVTGTIEAARRFGNSDVYGELRIDQRLSPDATAYVSVGGTPDADFRPRWQIGAGGSVRVRRGPEATVLTLDARQARYRAGDIQTVTPGVEQYVAGGRFWLTGRMINIFDENGRHHAGWMARGDALAGRRLRLFAGAADAPDVSEGIVTDTFTLFGGAAIEVRDRTTLRFSIAHEDRDGRGKRLQLGVGLGFRW